MAERRGQANRAGYGNRGRQNAARPFGAAGRGAVGRSELEQESYVGYYPRTNDGLLRTAGSMPEAFRGNLSLTVSEIELNHGQIKLEVDRSETIARLNERVAAPELPSREVLAEQAVVAERDGEEVELDGQFPIDLATTLIIGDQALAFGRPEIMTSASRGVSGAVGPAQELPGHGLRAEIGEEYFIIARQGAEEVIVALQTDEPESRRLNRVLKTKERLVQNLRDELQSLLNNYRANREKIDGLNKRIADLTKPRRILFIREANLPKEIEGSLTRIETKINGESDVLRGMFHFDQTEKQITIGRPIKVDFQQHGINPNDVRVFDGTGNNRDLRFVSGDERGLSPVMRRMLANLHRPRGIQKADRSIVPFAPLSWSLYRQPSAVPGWRG